MALGFQAQAICALPLKRKRALGKKRCEMATYKCDPRWITVKFKGNACLRCKRPVHPGERAFYYPADRSLCCDSERCGKAASREFDALAWDEDCNH